MTDIEQAIQKIIRSTHWGQDGIRGRGHLTPNTLAEILSRIAHELETEIKYR